MANLSESSTFDAGVYQLETTDPLLGGSLGVLNSAPKNLANRTKYLKDHVDALEAIWDGLVTVTVTGDIDVTLTEEQAAHGIIELYGTLTGDINVIVPTGITRQWIIKSNFTGNSGGTPYTVTVKTAAGAGCEITQGCQCHIYTDGVDVLGQAARHEAVANGYFTLFQGIVVQFGKATVTASSVDMDVTLPIPFPNAMINVFATSNTGADCMVSAKQKGSTLDTITLAQSNAATRAVQWLAIGY